jgi:hypothetical protein
MNQNRLYWIVFCAVLAAIVSSVGMWGLWESRTSKGTCDGLGEATCWKTKYCHYEIEREGDRSYCRRKDDIDTVAGLGIFAGFICWGIFVVLFIGNYKDGEELAARFSVASKIAAGALAVFTIFLGALWLVTGSMASLVFFGIFSVFYF